MFILTEEQCIYNLLAALIAATPMHNRINSAGLLSRQFNQRKQHVV